MAYLGKQGRYYWVRTSPREVRLGYKSFSTKCENKRLADQILVSVNKKIKNTTFEKAYQGRQPAYNITIDKAFELYCQDRENTAGVYDIKTIKAYQESIRILKQTCGDKNILEYDKQDYSEFVNSLQKKGNSVNTKSIRTKHIYSLFNWLVKEEYIPRHCFKRVREQPKDLIIRTEPEIKKLLEFAGTTKFYDQVRFQLIAAARLDETLSLKKSYIKKDYIKLWSKGNKFRTIIILPDMRRLLASIKLPEADGGLVFPFSKDAVWRFYERVRKNTGLDFHSHELRSYTLSKLANDGRAMQFVRQYAGHASIKMTEKYYIRIDQKAVSDNFKNITFNELEWQK